MTITADTQTKKLEILRRHSIETTLLQDKLMALDVWTNGCKWVDATEWTIHETIVWLGY